MGNSALRMGRASVSILVLCTLLALAAVSFQAGRGAVASGLLSMPISLDPSTRGMAKAAVNNGDGDDLWVPPPRGSSSQSLSSGSAASAEQKVLELKREGTLSMALPSDRVRENSGKGLDWLSAARAARQGGGQAEFEVDPDSSTEPGSATDAAKTKHAVAAVIADQKGAGKAKNTNLVLERTDLIPKIRRVSVFDQVWLTCCHMHINPLFCFPLPPLTLPPFPLTPTVPSLSPSPASVAPLTNPQLKKISPSPVERPCPRARHGES